MAEFVLGQSLLGGPDRLGEDQGTWVVSVVYSARPGPPAPPSVRWGPECSRSGR